MYFSSPLCILVHFYNLLVTNKYPRNINSHVILPPRLLSSLPSPSRQCIRTEDKIPRKWPNVSTNRFRVDFPPETVILGNAACNIPSLIPNPPGPPFAALSSDKQTAAYERENGRLGLEILKEPSWTSRLFLFTCSVSRFRVRSQEPGKWKRGENVVKGGFPPRDIRGWNENSILPAVDDFQFPRGVERHLDMNFRVSQLYRYRWLSWSLYD